MLISQVMEEGSDLFENGSKPNTANELSRGIVK